MNPSASESSPSTASEQKNPPISPAGRIFLAREQELAVLGDALDGVCSGYGKVVMLEGEPGIGKTALALKFADLARERGCEVIWGRCYEEEGTPPYWPWVQAIRSYIHDHQADSHQPSSVSGASSILESLYGIREPSPDTQRSQSTAPDYERFQLFDSVASFLINAAQVNPIILVLDDLQWADKSSLMLLEFIAREMAQSHLGIIGTYRDVGVSIRHPLSTTLGTLVREQVFSRIPVGGFDRDGVARFVEVSIGESPAPEIVEAVHSRTGGNPLFVTEVAQLLKTGDPDWNSILPGGVRDAIGRRLSQLSVDCNHVLSLAAVIGGEFDLSLLERLLEDWSGDRLLDAMEEALLARILEQSTRSPGRYRFSHKLNQETLLNDVSAARRVGLHARIGLALEATHGADPQSHAASLAYHFTQSVTVTGIEKMKRYSMMAGEHALALYAYEDALAFFEKASDVAAGPVRDSEAAKIAFGLGRAQLSMLPRHRLNDAVMNLRRAFDYYVDSGDTDSAIDVASYPIPPVPGLTGISEMLDRALTLVPHESERAAVLFSFRGNAMGIQEGNYIRANQYFQDALSIARRERDTSLELKILIDASTVAFFHLRWDEIVNSSSRCIELSRLLGDSVSELRTHLFAAQAFYVIGNAGRATLHAEAMQSLTRTVRDRYYLANALWINEIIKSAEGDHESAADINARVLEIADRDPRYLGTGALLRYQMGDVDKGDSLTAKILDELSVAEPGLTTEYAFAAWVIPAAGYMTEIDEHSDIALSAAESVFAVASAVPIHVLYGRIGVLLVAVQRADAGDALTQYDALLAHRGTMLIGGIAIDRMLGLLSHTLGRREQAASHFDDALRFCKESGYLPEYAWSAHDYARLLMQLTGHQHDEQRVSLMDEALGISERLGMKLLHERLTLLKEHSDSRTSGVTGNPGGLSPREVEVLQLVALGKSNREIASDLFISTKTVIHHVTAILNKTGAANRTEAAAYAAQHGLVSWG